MNVAVHDFIKCKDNRREKSCKRQTFLNSRKAFERKYNRNIINEIGTILRKLDLEKLTSFP
jgi:hypothetical protein